MENGHRNSGFSHEKWWIFPWQNVSSPEGTCKCHRMNIVETQLSAWLFRAAASCIVPAPSGEMSRFCVVCDDIYIYTYIYLVCIYINIYTCFYAYIYIHIFTYIYTYIYIYIYIYIYVNIHKYILIYLLLYVRIHGHVVGCFVSSTNLRLVPNYVFDPFGDGFFLAHPWRNWEWLPFGKQTN